MKFNHPFDDRFYEEQPFLTAGKVLGNRVDKTRAYLKKNKIDTCVMVFNEHLEESLKRIGDAVKLDFVYMGEDTHYFYVLDNVLFVIAFMGAPNAACLMEDLIDMGITKFLACGSAGLINNDFDSSKMLVVTDAVRDEGTSYHYAPPETKAVTDEYITNAIKSTFDKKGIKFEVGKIWTNDALYRETPSLIATRVSESCIAVDMECSTWCIVAKCLNVKFGEFVYFSDAVVESEWGWIGQENFKSATDYITKLAYEIAKEL